MNVIAEKETSGCRGERCEHAAVCCQLGAAEMSIVGRPPAVDLRGIETERVILKKTFRMHKMR